MDSFSKCSICHSSYALFDKTPKILSCGDTFCSSCLISNTIIQQREGNNNNNMMITCVKCAKVTVLSNNEGVNGLLTNNDLKELAFRLVENEIDGLLDSLGSTYSENPNGVIGGQTQQIPSFEPFINQHDQSLDEFPSPLMQQTNLSSFESVSNMISQLLTTQSSSTELLSSIHSPSFSFGSLSSRSFDNNNNNNHNPPLFQALNTVTQKRKRDEELKEQLNESLDNNWSKKMLLEKEVVQQQQVIFNTVTTSNPSETAISTTNQNTKEDHTLSLLSSHSTIDNGKLKIIFPSHNLSKGVQCTMKLHNDALKGKEINIGNPNQMSSTSIQPVSKKKISQIVNNGSLLTYSIFWKKDFNSCELFPLSTCCVDCALEPIKFRRLSVKFSKDGECKIPITLWCSPMHNKRPKSTVLILKIEIIYNDINVKGEVPILFKKHNKNPIRAESEQNISIQGQQQISLPEVKDAELELFIRHYAPSTTNTTIDTTPLPLTSKVYTDLFISGVPPEIFELLFGSI